MNLDQASAALIGAAVGAAAAVLSSFVTGWRQSKIEREKWLRSREDTLRSDTRSALAELAKTLASYSHSIMWSTYKALSSKEVAEEGVQNFEMELHKGIADMVSSQLHIAALDKALYERVTPLISEAIALGGQTFLALQAAIQDFDGAKAKLSSCNQNALALVKKVPNEFGNILHA